MENKLDEQFSTWFSALKKKAKELKIEIGALYIAYKRPDVPVYAKIISLIVVGYALSPVDLIPDFIPILGYLDDLIILPLGIALAIKLIPSDIMDECRKQSEKNNEEKHKNWLAGGIIIGVWILLISYILFKIIH